MGVPRIAMSLIALGVTSGLIVSSFRYAADLGLDIDDLLEIARQNVTSSLTDEEYRQYLHVDRCPQS